VKHRLFIARADTIRAAIRRTQAEIDDPDGITGVNTREMRQLGGSGAFTEAQIRADAKRRMRVLKDLLPR
jgi:Arc/MetJ-type ribon-helix-helix transcriptional regulator